jgi:ABC-type dipeptide/oligopeptide/nickel transport system ATPase subunit
MSSYLSLDSQVIVQDDLLNMYGYYNGIRDINNCRNELKKLLSDVKLYPTEDIDDALLDSFLEKKVFTFSGGQQQRYWFSRILFNRSKNNNNPNLLMLDESIASLDCITKNDIIAFLLDEILIKQCMSVFLISHDLRDINVIYKTLNNQNERKINDIFEHYEILNHGLYKVLTPFPEYTENLLSGKANKYVSTNGGSVLSLTLEGFIKDQLLGDKNGK